MKTRQRGFTILEILITVAIIMVVAAFAAPAMMRTVYAVRLRSAATDLSDLHQRARILAAKNNQVYQIVYQVGATPFAFIDTSAAQTGVYDIVNDPVMYFTGTVVPSIGGAPNGAGGVPNYVLVGDSGPGAWDNTMRLAYSPRGLPCAYNAPPTCATPAIQYFVYYLQDTRPGGKWAAVVVTKSGRSKVVTWSGTAWM